MIFFILIFAFFIILSMFSVYYLYRKVSLDHFYKLALRSFLRKQYKTSSDRYFCSYTILQTIKILYRYRKKEALINLSYARISKALSVLKDLKKDDIRISLLAHFDFEEALIEYERLIKKQPKNMFVLGEMAELYYLNNEFRRLSMVVERIEDKKSSSYTLGKKLYFQMLINLKDADFLSASIDGNKVLKLFNKNNALIEEARTYILLGIMYKASGIFDPAQFMFESALKIFTDMHDKIGIIETQGNLAMLMSAQERFEEAEAYLDKALDISDNSKSETYILNQKGLTNLLKHEIEKALEYLESAKSISEQNNNLNSLAFSNEIIAYVKYEQKNYEDAIKAALVAENVYRQLSNLSARLEVRHLQALSLFELKDYDNAEVIAREIIEIANKEQTSFHIANTYNLLGLIFINRGDLERAKSLFKESLRYEQKNDRFAGIATDYFNIGLMESKTGHPEEAKISLENALEFASIIGETKLSEIIKDKIKNLS